MVQMIRLRLVRSEDLKLLQQWRNDPFIYEKFFNAKPVTDQEHEIWFDNMLMNSACRLFIIEREDQKDHFADETLGQIRFDRSDDRQSCEVSVSLPERNTGKGYGTEAIRNGCARVQGNIWHGVEIIARFVPQNCRSKQAFRKAGFVFKDEKSITMVYAP